MTQLGYELGFLGPRTLNRRQMGDLPCQTTAFCIKHPSLSKSGFLGYGLDSGLPFQWALSTDTSVDRKAQSRSAETKDLRFWSRARAEFKPQLPPPLSMATQQNHLASPSLSFLSQLGVYTG